MVRAVLFDLDETLLDRTSSLRRFLADQHTRFFAGDDRIPFERFCDRFLELDQRGHVSKSIVYPVLLREFVGAVDLAETLTLDYRERCHQFAGGFAGLTDTLMHLRAAGLKLGLVTNGDGDFQNRTIDALTLRTKMDEILISEIEGLRKPDARLFHRAAVRLAVEPSACLFVGDNPEADIMGAHRAGMRTAWLAQGRTWPVEIGAQPGPQIESLVDLLAIVERATGTSRLV